MLIRRKDDSVGCFLEFEGEIDEDSAFPKITDLEMPIILDLDKVSQLNSCGIREWIKWIKPLTKTAKFTFKNCPKVLIDQINTVNGFIPHGSIVESFKVPYFCGSCDQLTMQIFQTKEVIQQGNLLLPETVPCSHCNKNTEMDVIPERYFKFLKDSA